jgi:glycosyltransferase involved in cell wall biosynthesis
MDAVQSAGTLRPVDPRPMALSVVVPCRNAATHLPGLLDALARERPGVPWEVVVVDNSSTDETRAIAEARGDLPVRVVDAPDHLGPGYARNVGAAAAAGEHVLFLDSDDLIAPGYLPAMHAGLATADIVGAGLDARTLNPGWAVESRPGAVAEGLLDHFDFLPYAPSGALGVRRAAFEQLGGFAEVPFAEDVDFCWRAQLSGKRLRAVPDATVHYRYRPTLGAMFAQAVRYGGAQSLLYRRYRDVGMPGRSVRDAAAAWRGLVIMLVYTRSKPELARSVFLLGVYVGRIVGSVRNRVVYL